jgi:hypothetical protein
MVCPQRGNMSKAARYGNADIVEVKKVIYTLRNGAVTDLFNSAILKAKAKRNAALAFELEEAYGLEPASTPIGLKKGFGDPEIS